MISPVILAGGAGKRLWPISRKKFPKQFYRFENIETLFQQCIQRLTSSDLVEFDLPITVTNEDFRFIVLEQFAECDVEHGPILIEPTARNTAPAILAATLHAVSKNPQAVLLVSPADHRVPDKAAFHEAVASGLKEVANGNLVIFGIKPTYPETGFGYFKTGCTGTDQVMKVEAFVEKPDLETASRMVKDSSYFWNAGIFLFRAKDMLQAFETYCADLIHPVSLALENGSTDLQFFRLENRHWHDCRDISIDHSIMERVSNLSAVKLSSHWSDLGTWAAVRKEFRSSEGHIANQGSVMSVDCKDSYLRSEKAGQQLVGIGLDNIVAVAMDDAVLIMDADKSQDVGKVVEKMREKGISQADYFPWEHRPWGRFEVLIEQPGFKVKRIVVKPGGILSLQKHEHRSEHWVVVKGTAKVTIDDRDLILNDGESVHVPLGSIHRMQNPGDTEMVLIEIQTGSYLGEDDIIRLEDAYARS